MRSSLVLNRAEEDLVMLVQLAMVEQRYDAVRELLDGATVTDGAIRYVSRRHRWATAHKPRHGRDAGEHVRLRAAQRLRCVAVLAIKHLSAARRKRNHMTEALRRGGGRLVSLSRPAAVR
jgi:hypothetical protein